MPRSPHTAGGGSPALLSAAALWQQTASPLTVFDREGDAVPAIVEDALQFLEQKALKTQGLFRVAGDESEIVRLVQLYVGSAPDSSATSKRRARAAAAPPRARVDLFAETNNVHSVAMLLKRYLRDGLPQPLFSWDVTGPFVSALGLEERSARIAVFRNVLSKLCPRGVLRVVDRLVGFLRVLTAFEAANSMNASNLAILFAPAFFGPFVDLPLPPADGGGLESLALPTGASAAECKMPAGASQDVIEFLVVEYEELFLARDGVLAVAAAAAAATTTAPPAPAPSAPAAEAAADTEAAESSAGAGAAGPPLRASSTPRLPKKKSAARSLKARGRSASDPDIPVLPSESPPRRRRGSGGRGSVERADSASEVDAAFTPVEQPLEPDDDATTKATRVKKKTKKKKTSAASSSPSSSPKKVKRPAPAAAEEAQPTMKEVPPPPPKEEEEAKEAPSTKKEELPPKEEPPSDSAAAAAAAAAPGSPARRQSRISERMALFAEASTPKPVPSVRSGASTIEELLSRDQ